MREAIDFMEEIEVDPEDESIGDENEVLFDNDSPNKKPLQINNLFEKKPSSRVNYRKKAVDEKVPNVSAEKEVNEDREKADGPIQDA